MAKFDYKKWVTENKYGKPLYELNEMVYNVEDAVNGNMPESGDKLEARVSKEHGKDTWQALSKWMDECNKIAEEKGWSHWRWSYTKGSHDKVLFMVEENKEKTREANTPNGHFFLSDKSSKLPQ